MPEVICILKNDVYNCRIEDFVCLYQNTCVEERCDGCCKRFFTCENCQFNEVDY